MTTVNLDTRETNNNNSSNNNNGNKKKQKIIRNYFCHPKEWIAGIIIILLLGGYAASTFITQQKKQQNYPFSNLNNKQQVISETIEQCAAEMNFLCHPVDLPPPWNDCLAVKMGPQIATTILNNRIHAITATKTAIPVEFPGANNNINEFQQSCKLESHLADIYMTIIDSTTLFTSTPDRQAINKDKDYSVDRYNQSINQNTIVSVARFFVFTTVRLFGITEALFRMELEEPITEDHEIRLLQIYIHWLIQIFETDRGNGKMIDQSTDTNTHGFVIPNVMTRTQVCNLMDWAVQYLLTLEDDNNNNNNSNNNNDDDKDDGDKHSNDQEPTILFAKFDYLLGREDKLTKFLQKHLRRISNIVNSIRNYPPDYDYNDRPNYFSYMAYFPNTISLPSFHYYELRDGGRCLLAFAASNQLLTNSCNQTLPLVNPALDLMEMKDNLTLLYTVLAMIFSGFNLVVGLGILFSYQPTTKKMKDNKRRFLLQFQDPVLRRALERRSSVSLATQEERDAFLTSLEHKVQEMDEREMVQKRVLKSLRNIRVVVIVEIIILFMFVLKTAATYKENWELAILPLLFIIMGCISFGVITYAIPSVHKWCFTKMANNSHGKDCDEHNQDDDDVVVDDDDADSKDNDNGVDSKNNYAGIEMTAAGSSKALPTVV